MSRPTVQCLHACVSLQPTRYDQYYQPFHQMFYVGENDLVLCKNNDESLKTYSCTFKSQYIQYKCSFSLNLNYTYDLQHSPSSAGSMAFKQTKVGFLIYFCKCSLRQFGQVADKANTCLLSGSVENIQLQSIKQVSTLIL